MAAGMEQRDRQEILEGIIYLWPLDWWGKEETRKVLDF